MSAGSLCWSLRPLFFVLGGSRGSSPGPLVLQWEAREGIRRWEGSVAGTSVLCPCPWEMPLLLLLRYSGTAIVPIPALKFFSPSKLPLPPFAPFGLGLVLAHPLGSKS